MYVLRTGCSWRQLPKDYPPWATVYWHFARWRKDGSLDRLHDALRDAVRRAEGRSEQPTAAIIDAQSVKGAATVGATSRGFDAGKKVNGRKRHVVVDTIGLLLLGMVTTASVQDRDGARPVLEAMSTAFPALTLVWADGGYAGKLVEWAKAAARIVLEIVKKPAGSAASRSCQDDGWSSARCPGSPGAGDWTATTNASRPPPKLWSNGQ